MVRREKANADPDSLETGQGVTVPQAGTAGADDCRCKEVAKMTPRQLLVQMMRDLAFWKQEEKG